MSASPLISTLLLALSLYAASLSIMAITRLQSWESASEKAAKVSSTAANQLWRTRTTQGAAAGAILLSASTALYNLLFRTHSFLTSLLSALVAAAAWYHFSAHWASQARVPGATQWNEAVEASDSLRTWLLVLAGTWVLGAVVGAVS